jgi:hypothetical protein
MRQPLFPLTAIAPAQVWSRSYVHGSGALTTRGRSWLGDDVAVAACDEPAASGVALPAGVALPPAVTLRRPPVSLRVPPTVTTESKLVVVVSTMTRQAHRRVVGCPPWSRECRRTESHPRTAGPRCPCRKY